MQNEWLLDVLADLTAFAHKNGLAALAEQLDDTRLIAVCEMASMKKGMRADDGCPAIAVGPHTERVGERN